MNHHFDLKKLPVRFQNKIEKDLDFILSLKIEGLKQICLFGSLARNDYKWNSDVDLAIITDTPILDHSLKGFIIDVLDDALDGVSTDIVFRTENTDCLSNTFTELFNRDKVVLWERDSSR